MRVGFDVSSCASCSRTGDGTHGYLVENENYVFADYGNGDLTVDHTFQLPGGGSANLKVTVTASERPPYAKHDLAAVEECSRPAGLLLDAFHTLSSDADNDIEQDFWWVDGVAVGHGTMLAKGTHVISLETRDARGAVDRTDDVSITVSGGGCT